MIAALGQDRKMAGKVLTHLPTSQSSKLMSKDEGVEPRSLPSF